MNQTAATIHPMTQRIRNLVLAGAAALAIATIPVANTYAANEQPNLCYGRAPSGEHRFYLPGERIVAADGQKYFCGADGQWHQDYSTLQTPPTVSTPKLPPANTATTILR